MAQTNYPASTRRGTHSSFFADTQLAATIEAAQCQSLLDNVSAVARRAGPGGTFAIPLAGGVAAFAGIGSPLNKLAGLGFCGLPSDGEFAQVEQQYFERDAPIQVEFPSLGDPSIASFLTRRGYLLVGFEDVLGFRLTSASSSDTQNGASAAAAGAGNIRIVSGEEADFETWLNVMIDGFLTPDTQGVPSHESFSRDIMDAILRDTLHAAGFHRYLVRRAGVVAAGAGMQLRDGIAFMCGAATLPEHRRQGIQTELLNRRLHDAAGHGCTLAVITTLPGSKSHENAQRQGFELLYTRAILVREKMPSGG